MTYPVSNYIAVALDPIHVGTGGQRLGRVDLTVVREPVTRVPKIPGTSISGSAKFFADTSLKQHGIKSNTCASTKGGDRDNNHDRNKCPTCCAFGFTPPDGSGETGSAQGILQFTDATLLAFPVNTLEGPVWITSKARLKDCLDLGDGEDDLKMKRADTETTDGYKLPSESSLSSVLNGKMNFGWCMLSASDSGSVPSVAEIVGMGVEKRYAKRFVVVPEWIFSHLVNDNMEVRTSVVIDPETGAAKTGGLFTYEAVTRGAIFHFQITESDYFQRWNSVSWENGRPASARAMMEAHGFPGLQAIGLGGMTTRGFGRLAIHAATPTGERA